MKKTNPHLLTRRPEVEDVKALMVPEAGFSHTHLFLDQDQIFKSISDLIIIFTPPTSFFKADHNLVKLNDLNKENLYHCII